MKTNFWKSAAALALGVAAMVACEKNPEPEKIAPVFPSEVIEQNVEAGASVELTFEANQDWEVSIPASEQNKYWLDDAGMPASKVSGKAGSQTVTVVFSEDEYYDQNVLCEVTLSMGGQSQVIAKLTRLAINRTLDVYTAETNSWGGFKNTYNAEKATALELVTFEGDPEYTQRIKVVANFDWSLSLPEWCEGQIKVAAGETAPESLSGQAGQVVEIDLKGKLTADVKAGASDFARFIDAADNSKSEQLALTLPAFENRLEVTAPNSMEFDGDGVAAGMSVGYVLGMDGFVVRALEWNGEWHSTQFASWVSAEFASASEGESIFVQKSFTLGVTANESGKRYADIFVFPASMTNVEASDIYDPNDAENCSFKAEFEKYYLGRLTQAGAVVPYISVDETADNYAASLTKATESAWWASKVGGLPVANQYELAYWDKWSDLTMVFDSPYASYKIFDFDFNEVTADKLDNFWLTFTGFAQNSKGRVVMDPELFDNADAIAAGFDPESVVVFYDAEGNALAAVTCKYTSAPADGGDIISATVGSAEIMPAADMSMEGALNQLISAMGVTAQNEYVVMASTAEVELTTNFNISSIFIFDMQGNMVEAPADLHCYQNSMSSVQITASPEANYLLLFMDASGNFPLVAYYMYYPTR